MALPLGNAASFPHYLLLIFRRSLSLSLARPLVTQASTRLAGLSAACVGGEEIVRMPSLLADEIQKVYITEVVSFGEKLFPQFSLFLSNTANEQLLPFQCYGGTMLASVTPHSKRHTKKCST